MCGILALIHDNSEEAKVSFMKGQHRGPDHSSWVHSDPVSLGFHRLAINGLDDASNQPFEKNGIYLICNGEIYNHKELYASMKLEPKTKSDCEVILDLYIQFGIEHVVHTINASEFAFVLYDSNKKIVFVARDPYGVRPLLRGEKDHKICFASEFKMMPHVHKVTHFMPGTITALDLSTRNEYSITYTNLPSINPLKCSYSNHIRQTLYECVKQRVMNMERPMACLLSGGLDSSLIAMLVNQCRKELGMTEPLETYSIGLEGAEDLKYADIMAQFLGSKHTSLVVEEKDFLDAIPEVIYAIESRDTTTVRASVGNYLICKHIKEHSDAKVIFNGDGSDEVCGGYLYMKKAPNEIEFDKECRRLVTEIYMYDALRSDRSISSHGLESRTPFLDRAFVEMYMSIPTEYRYTTCEKFALRTAFKGMLPDVILWRKKEAFSDGVSSMQRSWFSIIQESIPGYIQDEYKTLTTELTLEQYYYKKIYDSYFHIDMFYKYWMPKYTNSKDCSARTLENY
jgi:asparagine synthase (glutamine-hydrolysing)